MRFTVQRKKLRLWEIKQPIQGPPAGKRGDQGTRADSLPCRSQPPRSGMKTTEHQCASVCFPLPLCENNYVYYALQEPVAPRSVCLWRIPGALAWLRRRISERRGPPSPPECLKLWERTWLFFLNNNILPSPGNHIYKFSTRFLKVEKIPGGETASRSLEGVGISLPIHEPLSLGRGRPFPKEAVPGMASTQKQVPGFQISV